MTSPPINTLMRRIRLAALPQDAAAGADGQLMEAFVRRRDEAAFAILLRRHGPMVLNVCRRVVGNHHDAEDAFQATFLVLAQKAASVSPRERVAGWLHGVAYRIALKANQMRSKIHARERQVWTMPEPETPEPCGKAKQLPAPLDFADQVFGTPARFQIDPADCRST